MISFCAVRTLWLLQEGGPGGAHVQPGASAMMGKEQHVVGFSGSPYTEACLCLTANSREERSQALGVSVGVAPWLLGI